MLKVPWRKIVVIGSTFVLGVCAGLSMLLVADPDFRTTFANDNAVLTSLSNDGTANASSADSSAQAANTATAELQKKIVDDYKTSLALLFEAWRSPNMEVFKNKITNGYTGDILNRHLDRAEQYISGGKGINVENLIFNIIEVESADASTATVKASYSYSARDFDTAKTQAYGENVKHEVEVRANLVKVGERWLISGETAI